MYIKNTIKHKEQQDVELGETIEYMWVEYQGKNKNSNYLVGVFYQPRPEDKKIDADSKARYDTFSNNDNLK